MRVDADLRNQADLDAVGEVTAIRYADGSAAMVDDILAVEAPLTLQIQNRPFVTVMRTPGHDEDLICGFLRAEGIVEAQSEILALRPCDQLDDPEHDGHVYQVSLAPEAAQRVAKARRNMLSASSCGLCGREQIQRVTCELGALPQAHSILDPAWVLSLPQRLADAQPLFAVSGAVHAAGIIAAGDEEFIVVREDVGRHNAVDKVTGWMVRRSDSFDNSSPWVLVVSGRVAFEIVQKALVFGCIAIVAVSAPTSLAVELAHQGGLTLIGFTRNHRCNIYTHPQRFSAIPNTANPNDGHAV